MDLDMQMAEYFAIFCQWQEDHPVEAEEVRFEFLEVTDTTLNFRAKEKLFQLLIPTGLLQGKADPNQTFIAMSLDNSAPNSLLVSLNEKLERVPIGPQALAEALDVFASALISFEAKRKRPQSEKCSQRPNGKGLLHGFGSAMERWKNQANAGDDDTEMRSDNDSDGDTSPEDGLAHCSRGYLHDMIKEARDKCQAARFRSVESFLHIPPKPTFSGPGAMLYVDDVLQFCHVSNRAEFQVRIKAEVAGFVNDMTIAASLGFSCSNAMEIVLEFDRRDSNKPLTLNRVVVDPSAGFSKDQDATKIEADQESDEEYEKECRMLRGKQTALPYGTSVLLPELIQTFFRYRSGETSNRPTPWVNETLDQSLQYFAKVDNPLIGLICFIGCQLKALPSWCSVCWSSLPASVRRLSTCKNDFCLYEFEEVGLGASLHHEIQESPAVVELELSLASAAACSDRDVFEPFPSFFLECQELRGRSGWFSGPSKRTGNIKGTTTSKHGGAKQLTSINRVEAQGVNAKSNKKLSSLLAVLQTIPHIPLLRDCADEDALKKKLSKAAFSVWRNKAKDSKAKPEPRQMLLSYDLMRFILSTNRSSLRVLNGEEELGLTGEPKFQFVVLHDSPEKEAIFNQRRAANGSFFAFHGSGFGNWYSILRNGLRPMSNTKYMSTGAAYGHGIYLANNFNLSYSYATRGTGLWKNGTLKDGTVVIAICEVVAGCSGSLQHSSIYVVPFGQEDSISVRYLLVMGGSDSGRSWPSIVIDGCILKGSGEVNLREKYERLTVADQKRQQQTLLDKRMDALVRVKGYSAFPEADPELDQNSPSSPNTEPSSSESSVHSESGGESPTSKRGEYLTSGSATLDSLTSSSPTSKRLKENYSVDTTLTLATTATQDFRKTTADTKPLSALAGLEGWMGFGTTSSADSRPAIAAPAKKDSAGARPALPATATQAITKEFKNVQREIRKAQQGTSSTSGPQNDAFLANITIDIPLETDISVWDVKLSQNLFTSYPKLYKDLQNLATSKNLPEFSVLLEVTFPGAYPFEPPFVRVVRPKFVFHTGHVTIGGSICMELLTPAGWLPSFSFESVLVQIVNAFIEGEGRVDTKAIGQDYSKEEAQKAFTRVAGVHGWTR